MTINENLRNNPEKVLNIILGIVNNNEVKYVMKIYHTGELKSITEGYCDRELTNEHSLIWVIGLKETINKIDEWGSLDDKGFPPLGVDLYHPYAFQYEFTKLINEDNSLIILTNHSDEYQVIPKEWEINKDVSKIVLETYPMVSNIYCYNYNDELKNAINLFEEHIKKNNNQKELKKIKNNYNHL